MLWALFAAYLVLMALNVVSSTLILKINRASRPTRLASAACLINVVSIPLMYFIFWNAT